MDMEVLEIGNRDKILELSWLIENGFSVDMQKRCLRFSIASQVIRYSLRWILSVLVLGIEEPLVDGEILLIIDAC